MPVTIPLLDLVLLDDSRKFWPDEFRAMTANIEQEIDPACKPEIMEDLEDSPPVVVEIDKPKEAKPKKTGPFDRTPVGALADWLKENDEPWLERAARFLVRHQNITIKRQHSYGKDYYWKFSDDSMPDRWKYLSFTNSPESFAALLACLAKEIRKRIEEIEGI